MAFFRRNEQLDQWGDRLLEATWARFPDLSQTQIALTWLVYDDPVPVNTGGALTPAEFWQHSVRGFTYRGMERIYPASIVKLFYLVAIQEWLDKNMVPPSAELDRAIRDMIVDSSNDATSLVVDLLTGTTSGPELAPAPFATWKQQRNLVNRYFQSWNWPELQGVNINQKTWCDGAYGRERAFLTELPKDAQDRSTLPLEGLTNRNQLTTTATAKLLHSIIGGVAVSAARSQGMMGLLKRSLSPEALAADPENQVTGFLAGGLPPSAQVWSKAGWTSQVRHDALYAELPDRRPFLLVVFTEGKPQSRNPLLLPFIATQVVEAIDGLSG